MSRFKVIILPDGSRCHSGPNCQKHGSAVQNRAEKAKIVELKTKIDAFFTEDAKNEPESADVLPEWWSEYHQGNFDHKVQIFEKFGVKKSFVPGFNENAVNYGFIGVETDDKDTQLVVKDSSGWNRQGEKYFCHAYMLKHGKPVAMLHFATYPLDYVPEGGYPYTESVICDIEVREGSEGKKYGLEIIRQVEKNILNGRLIHSGGSYTPEGRQALGGKLPYTTNAKKYDRKKELDAGLIPKSSFDSMKFVADWDKLQTFG